MLVRGLADRSGDMHRSLIVNLAACLLLFIQYLLGMVVNVFVVLPGHPGANAANYFSGSVTGFGWLISSGPAWAAAHAAFGVALVVAAVAAIALTWRTGGRAARTVAILGALAIIGAGFNGVSFLTYGKAFSSMIMAGLWALALACYLIGAVLAVRAPEAANPRGQRVA
jgi:hypothetical protein